MPEMVSLTIDGKQVSVPAGTLIVDAAKKIGIDIPVFCYHPKMAPVGMCRMCLVEVGRPAIDRTTGQPQKNEDGTPKIQFGPKLETACTTPVSESMQVRGLTDKVQAARKEVVEFLLTSHPLDCPICDKGGECPLQNLTMRHGSGHSRFIYGEKMRLAKHLPLGDLIYLDRERCIQCARCVRFQDEIVDDPVIGFYARGRELEIVTYSEPGFDSYFSGNTTDICPVGALTTADFRFEARPWELNSAASICTQCPVGCNLTLNLRREARAGGKAVIKRIMPRQNESVNEIWICDKGRFGYHFAQSDQRLTQPLVRQGDELVATTWEIALDVVAEKMRALSAEKAPNAGLVTLAGGRLANEDLFNLRRLTEALGGQALLNEAMGGGELVAQFGLGDGSNIKDMGKGTVILVVASDLHEEAPIWWLRVKQAVERGAVLIVANARETKLDRVAAHSLRYFYGEEAKFVSTLLPGAAFPNGMRSTTEAIHAAAEALAGAENSVIFFGHDGLGLEGSSALAQACAQLIQAAGRVGKPNNGIVAVWPHCNTQGAWDMGFRPAADLPERLAKAGLAWIVAADPAGDDPALGQSVDAAGFVVVQDLFLTETARRADVVLPAVPFSEREGSYTNGERRVQRFYQGIPAHGQARPDFTIAAQIALRLGVLTSPSMNGEGMQGRSTALIMRQIAAAVAGYAGVSYEKLAETTEQWPIVGRKDLYYGGTTYDNHQGLGVKLPALGLSQGNAVPLSDPELLHPSPQNAGDLLAVPIDRLYDHGTTLEPSRALLKERLAPPTIWLHPETVNRFGLTGGEPAQVTLNGVTLTARVLADDTLPVDVVLVPRSVGLPIAAPSPVQVAAIAGQNT